MSTGDGSDSEEETTAYESVWSNLHETLQATESKKERSGLAYALERKHTVAEIVADVSTTDHHHQVSIYVTFNGPVVSFITFSTINM